MVSRMMTWGKTAPEDGCPRCWRRHKSWRTLARFWWPRAIWISGDGTLASVSACHRGNTMQLHPTIEAAEQAKLIIDRAACGGRCVRAHKIVDIRDLVEAE